MQKKMRDEREDRERKENHCHEEELKKNGKWKNITRKTNWT